MYDYIENAIVIKSLNDLPKINEFYKGINNGFKDYKVISLEAFDSDEHDAYLFYKVLYQDTTVNNENYFYSDCCYFTYAIHKSNI